MSDVVERLRAALGERVRTDGATLDAHRRDHWVLEELRDLEGTPPPRPVAVVRAASTEDVSRTLGICREVRNGNRDLKNDVRYHRFCGDRRCTVAHKSKVTCKDLRIS